MRPPVKNAVPEKAEPEPGQRDPDNPAGLDLDDLLKPHRDAREALNWIRFFSQDKRDWTDKVMARSRHAEEYKALGETIKACKVQGMLRITARRFAEEASQGQEREKHGDTGQNDDTKQHDDVEIDTSLDEEDTKIDTSLVDEFEISPEQQEAQAKRDRLEQEIMSKLPQLSEAMSPHWEQPHPETSSATWTEALRSEFEDPTTTSLSVPAILAMFKHRRAWETQHNLAMEMSQKTRKRILQRLLLYAAARNHHTGEVLLRSQLLRRGLYRNLDGRVLKNHQEWVTWIATTFPSLVGPVVKHTNWLELLEKEYVAATDDWVKFWQIYHEKGRAVDPQIESIWPAARPRGRVVPDGLIAAAAASNNEQELEEILDKYSAPSSPTMDGIWPARGPDGILVLEAPTTEAPPVSDEQQLKETLEKLARHNKRRLFLQARIVQGGPVIANLYASSPPEWMYWQA
jgi:hypothetical protein